MSFPSARTEYDQTFAFLGRKSKRTVRKVACKATKSLNDIFKASVKGTAPAPSCAKVPSIITAAAQQDASAATAGLLMLQTLRVWISFDCENVLRSSLDVTPGSTKLNLNS